MLESVKSLVGLEDPISNPILEVISSVGGWTVSVKRPVLISLWFFLRSAVSLTRSVLQYTGSFGDWGVSLTRPVLESISSFVWRAVSLTRLVLDSRRSVLGEFV